VVGAHQRVIAEPDPDAVLAAAQREAAGEPRRRVGAVEPAEHLGRRHGLDEPGLARDLELERQPVGPLREVAVKKLTDRVAIPRWMMQEPAASRKCRFVINLKG
jgi:hypothetical protein